MRFDKREEALHYGAMKRSKNPKSCPSAMKRMVLLLCLFLAVVPIFSAVGVKDYLPSRRFEPRLPMDPVIGKGVERTSDPLVDLTVEAFSQPWSAQWVLAYVDEPVRRMFTLAWDETLAALLPVGRMVCSSPVGDESSKTVSLRIFSDSSSASPAFSVNWRFSDGDGKWYLVSIRDL